ncbi:DUF6870 family protein [Anaerovorax odorimutans]|uniref:DUF6870 family protein n=1 Tax=Anaerovorax odorimutans TaxID=109327 RepID=UPI003B5036A9
METANRYTKEYKIKAYIKQNDNPYCFLSGETKVTMCFSDNSQTIENRLRQYFITMNRR